jgi:hypothetical protein
MLGEEHGGLVGKLPREKVNNKISVPCSPTLLLLQVEGDAVFQ